MTDGLARDDESAVAAAVARAYAGSTARVLLLGRDGCHLCDDARAVVARVADETGAGWVEASVDDDPTLLGAFSDQVPVVFVDGAQHDFWRVDETRLRGALTAAVL